MGEEVRIPVGYSDLQGALANDERNARREGFPMAANRLFVVLEELLAAERKDFVAKVEIVVTYLD